MKPRLWNRFRALSVWFWLVRVTSWNVSAWWYRLIRAVNRAVAVPFRLFDVDLCSLFTYSSSMNMCLPCVDVAIKPCVCVV